MQTLASSPSHNPDHLAALVSITSVSAEKAKSPHTFRHYFEERIHDLPIETLAQFGVIATCALFLDSLNSVITEFKPEDEFDPLPTAQDLQRQIQSALQQTRAFRIASDSSSVIAEALKDKQADALDQAIKIGELAIAKIFSEYTLRDERTSDAVTFTDWQTGRCRSHSLDLVINVAGGESVGSFLAFSRLLSLHASAKFHQRITQELERANYSQIAQDTEKYGAKGANLLALVKAREILTPFLEQAHCAFQVPPFYLVPAVDPEIGKTDSSHRTLLLKPYEWIAGRAVMIRSSAVYSEDGEHLGAGIYLSVKLPANASFERFCKAADAVYDSTNSALAVNYRANIKMNRAEKMGIIVQELVEHSYDDAVGHINTVRPHLPSIIDVVVQDREIPEFAADSANAIEDGATMCASLDRHILEQDLGRVRFQEAMVTTYDYSRCRVNPHSFPDLAVVGLMLEYHFGRPAQIEYVCTQLRISVVQLRPLPPTWIEQYNIRFPDREDFIWEGKSFGAMDAELEILSDQNDNSEREGIVIFNSQHMGSLIPEQLEKTLPKRGAVLIFLPSSSMGGHIESRCIERGLTIINGEMLENEDELRSQFLDRFFKQYGCDPSSWFFDSAQPPRMLPPSQQMSKLRVVSDGLKARIYPV